MCFTEVINLLTTTHNGFTFRWYNLEPMPQKGKQASPLYQIDRLAFPPMVSEGTFDFINPRDVIQGCHIIPAFARGRRFPDGKGLSKCVKDSQDWKGYYIFQYDDLACLKPSPY